MQLGPVDEFLNIAVERPALDQFKIKVSSVVKNGRPSGLASDHGE